MSSQDDGSSVQVKTIFSTDGRKYVLAGLNGGVGRLCEPEVSKNPHAEQVVAEVTERTILQDLGAAAMDLANLVHKVNAVSVAAVDGIAVGREPPILPEIWGGYIGDRIAVCVSAIRNTEAGCGGRQRTRHVRCTGVCRKGTVGKRLLQGRISLEVTHNKLHRDISRVRGWGGLAFECANGNGITRVRLLIVQAAVGANRSHRARIVSFKHRLSVQEGENRDKFQG